MDRKEARRKAQDTIGGMKGYMELRERELQQFFRRQLEWPPHLMKIWFEK